jgi:sigma-E factor negative regulatory protein RseB
MKFLNFVLFLFCFGAFGAETESAKSFLERLSSSLRQLNFTTSFVVVKNNQVAPYHWLHGIGENNQELEILTRLNGSRRDILRRGDIISYIEPEKEPYSIISKNIQGPIPAVFRGEISLLENSYRFISVGRSRVLGRVAQLVRIVAKDKYRFSYWLWLDQQTGLLLKLAVVTRKGQVLEQVQFTHIEVNETLPDSLDKFQTAELPAIIKVTPLDKDQSFGWKIGWLPEGFNLIKSNKHNLSGHNQEADKPVEFLMFSDGLIDLSVYVNSTKINFMAPEYASDGATIVFNHISQGMEVGIVGDIPLVTARKIADSIIEVPFNRGNIINNNLQGSDK